MNSPLIFKTEITGRHVLYGIVGFFFIITSVDVFMIYKALSTFGGIETSDAYRKGLHYNHRIEAEKLQKILGWRDEAKFDGQKEELSVFMSDVEHKGIDGLNITAILGRPATNREDHIVELSPVGSGRYVAPVHGLKQGTWIAALSVKRASSEGDNILYQSKVRLWKAP